MQRNNVDKGRVMEKIMGPRKEEDSNLLLPLQLQIMGMGKGRMKVVNLMKMERRLVLVNKGMEMERNAVVVETAGTTITTMEIQTITTMARIKTNPQKMHSLSVPISINLHLTMRHPSINTDSFRCHTEIFHLRHHQSHN